MALSEQEQRLLDEMERHLYQNEADVMSTTPRQAAPVSTRSVVLAILAVAVGLGIVVAGLATQLPIIGIAGFVVMLVGVLAAFRTRPSASGEADASTPRTPSASGAASKGRSAGTADRGFMDRLEDRWDRRRNGE